MVHLEIDINCYNDGSTLLDRLFLKSPKEKIFSVMIVNIVYLIAMNENSLYNPLIKDCIYYPMLFGLDLLTIMFLYIEVINIRELLSETIHPSYTYSRWRPSYKTFFRIHELQRCNEIVEEANIKTTSKMSLLFLILFSVLLLPLTLLLMLFMIIGTCFQIIITFFEYSALTIIFMFASEFIGNPSLQRFLLTICSTSGIIILYLFGVYIYTIVYRERIIALLESSSA